MNLIDRYLDGITMYRLLLYYLGALLAAAMLFGAIGYLSFSPVAIAVSVAYLVGVCWLTNRIFAGILRIPSNHESSLLTALILALIITPPASTQSLPFLTAAAGLAIASKYLLTWCGHQIFNPAAIAVALTAFGPGQSASWWVGNAQLAPIVIVGGLLLVRKTRRFQMVVSFLATATVTTVVFAIVGQTPILDSLSRALLHSSLLFLAFVMLTEPRTSPTQARQQRWYGILTGLLFPPQVQLLAIFSTPELVLVVGNIYAFIVNPRRSLLPRLLEVVPTGTSSYDFVFAADQALTYRPGQFMEFTLPHAKPDARGSRRYFTLASSPTEPNLRLGVKFYPNGSTFKQALRAATSQTRLAAAELAGEFVLPNDRHQKLAFIAGGIGVTPFRSMLKYLVDTNDLRDVTLLYSERTAADVTYQDVFSEARQRLGTKIVYTLTDTDTTIPTGVRAGFITSELITAEIPDFSERLFYISGPYPMVTAIRSALKGLGVADRNIKIDFFPGYA